MALVAAALGLTLVLQNVVSTAGHLFFYTAVVASALFGGKWSGGLAVILSLAAVAYYFTLRSIRLPWIDSLCRYSSSS